MLRVGIFKGEFSPVHNGQIAAAKAFIETMWLDVMFVVPTADSPKKESDENVSAKDRLKMCELAFSGVEGVIVSDIEIRQQGKAYTVDILRQLTDDDRRLFLLCGSDVILTLDELKEANEIFKLCYPTYVRREEDGETSKRIIEKIAEYKEKYGRNVVKINAPAVDLSSSEIRATVRAGKSIKGLVTDSVADYIASRGLYLQ